MGNGSPWLRNNRLRALALCVGAAGWFAPSALAAGLPSSPAPPAPVPVSVPAPVATVVATVTSVATTAVQTVVAAAAVSPPQVTLPAKPVQAATTAVRAAVSPVVPSQPAARIVAVVHRTAAAVAGVSTVIAPAASRALARPEASTQARIVRPKRLVGTPPHAAVKAPALRVVKRPVVMMVAPTSAHPVRAASETYAARPATTPSAPAGGASPSGAAAAAAAAAASSVAATLVRAALAAPHDTRAFPPEPFSWTGYRPLLALERPD